MIRARSAVLAGGQAHGHEVGPGVAHLQDTRRKDVEDARRTGPLEGDAHVAGGGAGAEARPRRAIDSAHPQRSPVERELRQVVGVVVGDHGGVDDGAGVVGERRGKVEAGQRLADGTAPGDPSALEEDDVVGEARHFVDRVAHVDHRDRQLVAQALEAGHEVDLARGVERRQWLVEEEELRLGEERLGDRDALAFAAGEVAGRPREQRLEPELTHHPRAAHPARARRTDAAVVEVLRDREVREERRVLEDVADATAVHREKDAARVVLPALAEDVDLSPAALEPRQEAQARGLAAARWAPQCSAAPTRELEPRLQAERAAVEAERRTDRGVSGPIGVRRGGHGSRGGRRTRRRRGRRRVGARRRTPAPRRDRTGPPRGRASSPGCCLRSSR